MLACLRLSLSLVFGEREREREERDGDLCLVFEAGDVVWVVGQ